MGIDKAAIIAALKMPPEQAVEFLRSKGLQVSDSWRDLWQTAHLRAFTVAHPDGPGREFCPDGGQAGGA